MPDQIVDELSVLDKAISSPDDQNRKDAINLVNQKIENDKEGHANTNTQWGPLIFSLLGRDYKGALNAWNGGLTRQVNAFGPDNSQYLQEYNSRGPTGRIFDTNGNALTPNQIKELENNGGLISKEDVTAASGGVFQSNRQGVMSAAEASRGPALQAYKKAQDISVSSAGIANLYKEQSTIAQRAKWMDAVSKLTPDQRSKLYQIVSQQNQASQGMSSETGKTTSVTAGEQKGTGKTTGAQVGGDIGLRGAVPPDTGVPGQTPGKVGVAPSVSGGVSGGESSFANVQGSSTAGARTQAGTTSGTSQLQQQNFQSAVNGILQNAITTQEEFNDLQRFISLQNQITKAQETRGVENIAPGATPVPEIDPALSGRQNATIASYQGMKNEALLSAWNHFLANKIHSARGKPVNLAEASNDFMATTVAQGINNRYDKAINSIRTGKAPEFQKGEIVVDDRNRPKVWLGDKWEFLNVK